MTKPLPFLADVSPLEPRRSTAAMPSASASASPSASASSARGRRRSIGVSRPAIDDAVWVLLTTAAIFLLSSAFEWQEKVAAIAVGLERWQIDELPITLTALALGLAWYAGRRRHEAARLLAQNRGLARRLISVQEEERILLARELHDELAQHCTAIRLEAAYLRRSVDPVHAEAAARRTADAAERLQQGVRRMLHRLRPPELDELGLVDALQALCAAWERRSGVACGWRAEGGRLDEIDEAAATGIYRIAQEACENVLRHARAQRVDVFLSAHDAGLVLEIADDGCGFDADGPTPGLGLLGAAERAAALGGRLDIESSPGSGSCIRLWLPLARAGGRV